MEQQQRLPHIPDEVLDANILPRLPVKSLLRFRCVSQKWLHLISHTKVQKREKLMICTWVEEEEHQDKILYDSTSVDTEKKSQKVGETETAKYPPWAVRSIEIMGTCNGLLLVREYHNFFLWNPSIRYCRKFLSYHRLTDDGYSVRGGLCFDSDNNDYKVVLMLSHQTPSYGGKFATVGSSKTKDWKFLYFPYRVTSVVMGPLFNNYLHLFASPRNSTDDDDDEEEEFPPSNSFMSPHCIIYYDTTTDEFARVPMPEPIESEGDMLVGLGVLDGYFCMTRSEEPGKSIGTAQVLVMKVYGVKESWTVMFRIEGTSLTPGYGGWDSIDQLFYTREEGEILMRDVSGTVVAYDITKKPSNYIENRGCGGDMIVYEETMVQPVEYVWHREDICEEDGLIWKRNEYGGWIMVDEIDDARHE